MTRPRAATVLAVLALSLPPACHAETTATTIDIDGFLASASAAREARAERLLPLEEFLALARREDAVLLDTRSRAAFEALHLAGSVHLNFSDITQESLVQVLGDPSRPVLIYCNNNFTDDVEPITSKLPAAALNIPTFVTLWIYGYRNVYELADLLDSGDPRLEVVGGTISSQGG